MNQQIGLARTSAGERRIHQETRQWGLFPRTLWIASLLSGVLVLGVPGLAAADQDRSDPAGALAQLLAGRYQSDALISDGEGLRLTDHRIRVDNPELGQNVLYWQIDSGPEQRPYRQRLLVLELDPQSKGVRQRTWSLVEPERFVGQFDNPALFGTLTANDLTSELPEECDPLWQPIEQGWRGYTDPGLCRIFSERHQDWRYIEAEVEVTETGLRSTERGFDGQGRQLFGTEPGVFIELHRVGALNSQNLPMEND